MSAGFSGRCGAPQQRQLYPPRANTRQELLPALPGAQHSWTHQLSREQHFLPGEIYQLIPPSAIVTLSLEDPGGVPKHHTHICSFTAPFLKSEFALSIQRLLLVLRELCHNSW